MSVVPIIKKILEFRHSGSVLDVGTGFGHHALFLAEHGFVVTALDTNAEAIAELARIAKEKNLPIDARVGDVRTLDLASGPWDIVIATFVLHFLQDKEVEDSIRGLKAIAKPGGLNVIAAHTIENSDIEKARKPHLFEPNELKERYSDWKTLYYWQGLGKPFVSKRTGEMEEKYRADLIARKPEK